MNLKYSIVLPVFNEEKIIGEVIRELLDTIKLENFEIIAVNDGSTDNTKKELERFDGIRVISHPYNKGNGATVKTGIRNAKGEIIILMDGDGQHDPGHIGEMLKYMDEYDMVVGARDFNAFAHRNFANRIYNRFATFLTGKKIEDLTSGFRVIKAALAKKFVYLLPNGFSYPSTITLSVLKTGHSLKYVPIRIRKRTGKSKIRLLRDGINFLLIMSRITMLFSPFKVFLPASLIVFFAGLLHGLYRVFVLEAALTITTTFLLTTSLLILLLGLISEQITQLKYEHTE